MNSAHEIALVSAFVVPEKQSRYLELLGKPKRRKVVLDTLSHSFDFIQERATRVNLHACDDLERILRDRGATESAYVVSEDGSLDGREMPLKEALRRVWSYAAGSIISCVPGKLAFYKPEEPADSYILELRANFRLKKF
jgi:hypothetical protein